MTFVVDRHGLDELIAILATDGYEVFGPTVVDRAIRYRPIAGLAHLPEGVRDRQGPGEYRLETRDDAALFGFTAGPSSLADLFFPPLRPVWTATRTEDGVRFEPAGSKRDPIAVVGVKSCELAAARIHDTVLLGGEFVDPDYAGRRNGSLIIAVDCGEPGETCFCASMGAGPDAQGGYDIALTEVMVEGDWEYVGRTGSEAGERLIDRTTHRPASQVDIDRARSTIAHATASMGRQLDATGVAEFLADNPEHPQWADIAERCLACGNCTQACPTCFCVSTIDTSSLDGSVARRESRWDSCFSLDFSFMGGRPHRASIDARYRQWLTHKLSGWVTQFGTVGCVGCGRCITWCPVGIDFTVEVTVMMEAVHA